MNLYLLERSDGGYDEAHGFVVAATSPENARQVAADNAGGEGDAAWMDARYSTCKQIRASAFRHPQVILRDFNAG